MAEIIFSIHCSALRRRVVLFRHTWEGHVLPQHPAVRHKIPLIKKVLESEAVADLYEQIEYPKRVFIQFKCPDFLPINNFIRVTMKILDEKKAIVTSAYPVNSFPKEGVRKYESR